MRADSNNLDEILDVKYRVLHDGFVRVVDYMSNDRTIVRAARISFGKEQSSDDADRRLIRYLMKHRHTTPFEMCEIMLHIRIPMDIWRQVVRHRTASINEVSTRYTEAIDSTHKTYAEEWRFQSEDNKQGSADKVPADVGRLMSEQERYFHKRARELYKVRLANGVAREQARKDLPLSTFTEVYWKMACRRGGADGHIAGSE